MNFDFGKFNSNVINDFKEAYELVHTLENDVRYGNEELFYDEEHDLNRLKLDDRTLQIKLKILFALEYLGLTKMIETFEKDFSKYEKDLTALESAPYIDVLFSPALGFLHHYLSAITSFIDSSENKELQLKNSRDQLERILRNTPKILADHNINPEDEKTVRLSVYKMLTHIFADTVREVPIPKISKTYKPDIGIIQLKSAIEYKFAASEQDVKNAIGGIFEDTKGYENSSDWTTFYAVIYMTGHFFTQEQIIAEFKTAKVSENWKPILVVGSGSKRQKKKTIKSVKKK